MIIVTEETGTISSSATICDNDVRIFCPTSTLPVKTFTVPSSPIRIHAATSPDGAEVGEAVWPSKETRSCNTKATTKPPPVSLRNLRRSNEK